MTRWTLVYKRTTVLPTNKPFIAYWRNNVCLMQYDHSLQRYLCSAFPIDHMHILELKPRDVSDVTHFIELPHPPTNLNTTHDARKGNYGKYAIKEQPLER